MFFFLFFFFSCLARFKFARFDSLSHETQTDLSIEKSVLHRIALFNLQFCDYWFRYAKRKYVCYKHEIHVSRLEDNYFRIIFEIRNDVFTVFISVLKRKWKSGKYILSNVEELAFDIFDGRIFISKVEKWNPAESTIFVTSDRSFIIKFTEWI